MATITIWGRYKGGPPEVIDRTDCGPNSAAYLLHEYSVAFNAYHGSDWKLWAGRKDEEPREVGHQ